MAKQKELIILSKTRKFKDPMDQKRYISGQLLGYPEKNDIHLSTMKVLFYKNEKDKEPYWETSYGLYGTDVTFVAYHRRSLFRGLLNNLWRQEEAVL